LDCTKGRILQALAVEKDTLGTPSFLAVFCGKETTPSEIIHVTGGTSG